MLCRPNPTSTTCLVSPWCADPAWLRYSVGRAMPELGQQSCALDRSRRHNPSGHLWLWLCATTLAPTPHSPLPWVYDVSSVERSPPPWWAGPVAGGRRQAPHRARPGQQPRASNGFGSGRASEAMAAASGRASVASEQAQRCMVWEAGSSSPQEPRASAAACSPLPSPRGRRAPWWPLVLPWFFFLNFSWLLLKLV